MEGKVFGLLAWRRVPAQGSVAGLAVKIPLGYARRGACPRGAIKSLR